MPRNSCENALHHIPVYFEYMRQQYIKVNVANRKRRGEKLFHGHSSFIEELIVQLIVACVTIFKFMFSKLRM